MFGTDPLDELSIPDGTQVKEHDLVTAGDVLVGGQSVIELGVRGGTVVAGERVTVEGDIEADGDCRLDMWCEIDGNVLVGSDAYLGERVHITGQLIVSGDLDIGDDVEIERGFEANGWIVIRNPVPTIVFLFVYLSHLLRIGENEAAADVAEEFLSSEREAEPIVIPRGSRVSDDSWRVSTPATIGDECRLHGNIRAAEIEVGTDTEVFGSLRAKGPIRVGSGTVIHGDVTTRDGDVIVDQGANVRGGISCERCTLSEAAEVEGTIRARDGITLEDAPIVGRTATDSDGDGTDGGGGPTAGSASSPGLTPAIVPIGEGTLPEDAMEAEGDEDEDDGESEREGGIPRTFVPLESDGRETDGTKDRGRRPIPATVPIEASEFEWDAVGSTRSDGGGPDVNGVGEDVTAIITDAEDE